MRRPKIYLLVGCPGSGKSWVCNQLKDKLWVVAHDDYMGKGNDKYVQSIIFHARHTDRDILAETPFSVSQIQGPLEVHGFEVVALFIQESEGTLARRYSNRTGKEIPQGHLTRQKTYLERAQATNAFIGTSEEVLNYLRAT